MKKHKHFLFALVTFVVACMTAYPTLLSSDQWDRFLFGAFLFLVNLAAVVVTGYYSFSLQKR